MSVLTSGLIFYALSFGALAALSAELCDQRRARDNGRRGLVIFGLAGAGVVASVGGLLPVLEAGPVAGLPSALGLVALALALVFRASGREAARRPRQRARPHESLRLTNL